MFRLLQHGCKAKKVSMHRFVDEDFLLVFVCGGQPRCAGHYDVSVLCRFAGFENALTGRESTHLYARGQDLRFIVI
jgi:hypothetical protein